MLTKYRKFDGKKYVKGPTYITKKGAQDEATHYRKRGLLARVVLHKLRKPRLGTRYRWTVYSRRKK